MNQDIELLTIAYQKYYYAFIKKAYGILKDIDKAHDCIQEIMLILLQKEMNYEREQHARAIIYMYIPWICTRIKNYAYWGNREDSYNFEWDNSDFYFEPVIANDTAALNYWPISQKLWNHLPNLNPKQQLLIKMSLQGIRAIEMTKVFGVKKVTVSSMKCEAIFMLKNFRMASTKRDPLERSRLRTKDDKTDKIMEMTMQSIPDKEIAQRLGLSVSNVKCRRFDRKKLLKKIKQNEN